MSIPDRTEKRRPTQPGLRQFSSRLRIAAARAMSQSKPVLARDAALQGAAPRLFLRAVQQCLRAHSSVTGTRSSRPNGSRALLSRHSVDFLQCRQSTHRRWCDLRSPRLGAVNRQQPTQLATGVSVLASRARSQWPSGCLRYMVIRLPASSFASPPARGVTDNESLHSV
jgi:hypothetical protein